MISERVYRALLVAYPREFRREYGDLMVQLFRDRMRFDGGGVRGLIIWMQIVLDLAASAFKARAGVPGMSNGRTVIETEALTKIYGRIVAVDNLSMAVPRGHAFGLLGPNGSGKTTTMGMLLGLVRPTSGSFSLFGSSGGPRTVAAPCRCHHRVPVLLPPSDGSRESPLLPGHLPNGARREI